MTEASLDAGEVLPHGKTMIDKEQVGSAALLLALAGGAVIGFAAAAYLLRDSPTLQEWLERTAGAFGGAADGSGVAAAMAQTPEEMDEVPRQTTARSRRSRAARAKPVHASGPRASSRPRRTKARVGA